MQHIPGQNQAMVVLGMIRIAFLIGILAFGGVIWFLHSRPGFEPAIQPGHPFASVLPFVIGGAAAALVAVRAAASRQRTFESRSTHLIIGWAIGEAAALAGGAYYFLSDVPTWYIVGFFVFLLSLVLLPLRPD